MGRKEEPDIREELLEKSLEYCIKQGFSNFSLRALADDIGTSHRMIIYHFGSSDKLFEAVLAEFRKRQVANFEIAFAPVQNVKEFSLALKKLWSYLASEPIRYYMISYLEIQVSAIRRGENRKSSPYLNATLESWLSPIERTLLRLKFSKLESRIIARAILSAGRGLVLDNLAAGSSADSKQVKDSFNLLVDALLE